MNAIKEGVARYKDWKWGALSRSRVVTRFSEEATCRLLPRGSAGVGGKEEHRPWGRKEEGRKESTVCGGQAL